MDLREYLRERWTSTLLGLGKGSGTKFLFDGEQNQKEKTEQLGMEGHQHAKSNRRLWWPNTNQAKDDEQNQLGPRGLSKPRRLSGPKRKTRAEHKPSQG